jgi:signal transduction histidine kinase
MSSEPAHILVVDDEPDLAILMRQRFRHQLRDNIFKFDFASNGVDALEKIKSGTSYQLLMTDINMPEMDGLELLSKVRESYRHLKTIVVSAYSDLQNIRTAMNRGAFDFITKPINFTDLETTIMKTLEENAIVQLGLDAQKNLEFAQIEKEQALLSAKFKQQFLANMSHEIRTPLNAVVGMTHLLLEKNPREDQIKYLRSMKQASHNLLTLINDILDISKIEAGKITIERISFNPSMLMESICQTLHIKAEEKSITFNCICDADVPEWICGDPSRLTQVLTNLAGNAIKFTPELGTIIMRCSRSDAAEKSWVRFEVEDNGIGIEAQYLDKIFESFTQASNDTTRKFGGTGLGLTISRQLIDLMGGTIRVESEFGRGTRFYFDLPLEAGPAFVEEQPSVSHDKLVRPLKFLLAEDQLMNQMVATDILESLFPKCSVDIANNGQEAAEKAGTGDYDLVFMDIHMPVMDGFEATLQIRATGNTVPVVALTANVIREEVEKCLQVGMNRHLAKPFEPGILKQIVLELIEE